ncbi:glycosyltransferase [Niallia endozanthoxylica]|uniref:glycosyltransferase n=1 Tax=Niallia endozanthoxylica TaxID=2036016 RepID=UPI001CC7D827|nr:glycosyltransferase [Niallia endozanthoxylica]
MKKWFVSIVLVILFACLNPAAMVHAEGTESSKEECNNEAVFRLKYDMQELWIEYAWWTRSFIISNLANLEDQKDVLERLLQNQTDIGNSIKPYYGAEVGNKLTELLKEHILIAGKIIEAAKVKDQNNVEKYNKEWFRNADTIVEFLTEANPNWSKEELTDMFYAHLRFTTDEVTARLNKDWKGDIRLADLNEEHLIRMSGVLVDGIVKQFPEKFK